MREDDIFNGIGVEVDLPMYENFLKVKETLTRIGTLDGTAKLKQSCYLLHKRGRYVVAHVHELQWLDGLNVTPSTEDIAIRNRIAVLLESWKLVHIAEEGATEPVAPMSMVKVIAYRDKANWQLVSPYQIGRQEREDHIAY